MRTVMEKVNRGSFRAPCGGPKQPGAVRCPVFTDRCKGKGLSGTVRAFSLIELLVVAALIAVFSAMLLPALSSTKSGARSTHCKSNLRQLGVVLGLYLDDSAAAYPYTASVPEANPRGVAYWFDALESGMPHPKWGEGVFKCPAYQGLSYEGEASTNSRGELMAVYAACGSYAYNASGSRNPEAGSSGPVSPGVGFVVAHGQPVQRPVREGDICAPSELYIFGDAPLAQGPWGTVALLRWGGAADYNALTGENATVEKPQHSTVFNMLLADLHAESVPTKILLSTNSACRSRWNHDHLP